MCITIYTRGLWLLLRQRLEKEVGGEAAPCAVISG
jgi:hypothetical protein